MPWSVEQAGSALHVHISMPMTGEWEPLLDEIENSIGPPRPVAIHLPSKLPGATRTDREMLRLLWDALGSHGIPLLPPAGND